MHTVGTTPTGKRAVSGVFELQTSVGVPLDLIQVELRERGCVVAWDAYAAAARSNGWTMRTTYTHMCGAGLPVERVRALLLREFAHQEEKSLK